MALFLGSDEKLSIIEYNPQQPAFNTKELDELEKPVVQYFAMPHVLYIGSNQGCGCSFRHALYDNNEWLPVVWAEKDRDEELATQADHEALVNYLKASNLTTFEIHACWDGDYAQAEIEETITTDDLMDPDFFFKEKAHYYITISS